LPKIENLIQSLFYSYFYNDIVNLLGVNPNEVKHIGMAMSKYNPIMTIVGDQDIRLDFDIPRIRKARRIVSFLQTGPARKLIMHSKVLPYAKGIWNFFSKV
jgi:hypothetical protein